MAEAIRVGIIGAGWPGEAHARGYAAAGGFKVVAVADLIPERRKKLMGQFQIEREFASADELLAAPDIDAVSVCLPTHLHAPTVLTALKGKRHVICEKPPALSVKEAKQMERAAEKSGMVLLYSFQRRFGPHEQAAHQAIARGYVGDAYHVRASWTRTRAIPLGTGWFTQRDKSGGGALIDIGVHMMDLGWSLLGQPRAVGVFGVSYRHFGDLVPHEITSDVEDCAFALIRFEDGKSMELAASWAINQPPQQNGTVCRVYGTKGAIEVYTPAGAMLYRGFNAEGKCHENPLKPPKLAHHAALMRHFHDCIAGKATPACGGHSGVVLMEMVEAIYRSAETGKGVNLK